MELKVSFSGDDVLVFVIVGRPAVFCGDMFA